MLLKKISDSLASNLTQEDLKQLLSFLRRSGKPVLLGHCTSDETWRSPVISPFPWITRSSPDADGISGMVQIKVTKL
ncbi:MAG: hypothetical protein AB4426_20590 [Xenococcaceae cyanobacterium]